MSKSKEKFKQSETVIIRRSLINFAPYNPRKKDPKVVKKLKDNFKKVGFFGGIVWNEVTGNLISGHKRTEAMDLIHAYDGTPETDYDIKVERTELDEKTEKEQNIFFNSSTVQGEFDLDILRDMLPDIDYKAAGLDETDLNIIGTSIFEETDTRNDTVNELTRIAEQSRQKEALRRPQPGAEPDEDEEDDNEQESDEERQAKIDRVKAAKKAAAEKLHDEWEGDPYFTVTFDNYAAKKAFMHRLGLDPEDRFVKGEVLAGKVEVVSKF